MVEKAFPVKIGLEVHGYLDTREKLFCMCRTDSLDSGNNSRICPICTGQPGSKPMAVNEEAVRKVLQIATIFKSKINTSGLVWQRKHYNWADNPKGYQTTISGAHATTNATGGKFKGINITELHLEEDPAQWNPETGKINYNRSGLPLVEIVTEPEFSDSEQVVEWLKALVLTLSYVSAVRKNAGIKVDVNVSTYGERVEMKNLNSLEKIRAAIEYEIRRQLDAYEEGRGRERKGEAGYVQKRETLAYDEKLGKTIKMRSKEGASDYRFIPDPDLPEIVVSKKMIAEAKASLPEMPDVKLDKLLKKFKLNERDAKILTKNLELVEFFEEMASGVKIASVMAKQIVAPMKVLQKDLEAHARITSKIVDSMKIPLKIFNNHVNIIAGITKVPTLSFINLSRINDNLKVIESNLENKKKEEVVKFMEKVEELRENSEEIDAKKNVPWITVELLRVLNYNKKTLEDADVDVRPEHLAELIVAVDSGAITKLKGKQVMNEFIPKSFSLKDHKDEISSIDESAVENLCQQVIDENAHVVGEYKGGKDASLNFLIGQVMRLSERRADFKVAGETIKRLIGRG